MSDTEKPRRDLLINIDDPKRKILGTPDLALLRRALMPGVLEEFCRCFIQMDRLLSLRSLAYYRNLSTITAGKQRDLHTVIWMLIGTLRELGIAFDGLRTALVKASLFEKGPDWEKVQEFIERGNRVLKKPRDEGGFHIDSGLVAKGLDRLSELKGTTVITVQEGGNDFGFEFTLGIEALYSGLGFSEADGKEFMDSLLGDVDRVVTLLSKIFVATIRRAGIPAIKI